MANRRARRMRAGETELHFQQCKVDDIFSVILQQGAQGSVIASMLIALPEAWGIPAADAGAHAPDPEDALDLLQAATQPASPADIEQIRVAKCALQIDVELLADDRKVEASTIEG